MADAGPLIAFGRLDKLSLLDSIFDRVIVPRTVYEETQSRPELPDALAIRAAVEDGSLSLPAPPSEPAALPAEAHLGDGEAAVITLAARLGYGVLIDDSQGRTAATLLKLKVIGSVGVLILARERDLIPALAPLLEALRASGYYLSEPLIREALRRTGES